MDLKYGKVAICISGLPRNAVKANVAFNNFFDYLDADVFYHTWDDGKTELDQLKQVYAPINYQVEIPKPIDAMGSFGSMLYSIMMANELKKKHEIENHFRYDLVIKTRFDLVFPKSIIFPKFAIYPRTIYSHMGNNGIGYTDTEHHGINDTMFWGDSQSMDIVTNNYMYYKHTALPKNIQLSYGNKFDPEDVYFSAGNMMHYRGVRRNISFQRYCGYISAIPWREDAGHLDPVEDYDLITDRYKQL